MSREAETKKLIDEVRFLLSRSVDLLNVAAGELEALGQDGKTTMAAAAICASVLSVIDARHLPRFVPLDAKHQEQLQPFDASSYERPL